MIHHTPVAMFTRHQGSVSYALDPVHLFESHYAGAERLRDCLGDALHSVLLGRFDKLLIGLLAQQITAGDVSLARRTVRVARESGMLGRAGPLSKAAVESFERRPEFAVRCLRIAAKVRLRMQRRQSRTLSEYDPFVRVYDEIGFLAGGETGCGLAEGGARPFERQHLNARGRSSG